LFFYLKSKIFYIIMEKYNPGYVKREIRKLIDRAKQSLDRGEINFIGLGDEWERMIRQKIEQWERKLEEEDPPAGWVMIILVEGGATIIIWILIALLWKYAL